MKLSVESLLEGYVNDVQRYMYALLRIGRDYAIAEIVTKSMAIAPFWFSMEHSLNSSN